jgi:crotonobetainyl-CoA:carnitine CoA-transferase CaiB-like acyl-CoA transferase
MRRRAPQIGEDNDAIYTQDLGLSEGDLSELTTQGVI